ncbi:MAG: TIGR04211 family SH3 domain-containing protein [Desulfobacterales bacterium]|nr:TIGR04211 family SH3 domain-containing protein [Desulfobacterales bacterium]
MKAAVLFLACFFLTVTSARSEMMYVTDVIEVMVRTAPNLEHKIIAMPTSGTKVEVLEVLDEWARVRLPNEKEGWMLSRYLASGPPSKEVITKLERENHDLRLRAKALSERNARLKKERKELETALSKRTQTAQALKKAYDTLKGGSKDFLALKASYEKASEELATKNKQVRELEKEVEDLRQSQTLQWFLAGASVILVGFIIGYASRRSKRRPSLL